MYFPYLRGRQFELIAIRELVENELIGSKVIPIIEPIKPTSTLMKTINLIIEREQKIAVIHNPQVSTYLKALSNLSSSTLKDGLMNVYESENVIFSHILNKKSTAELAAIEEEHSKEDMLLILNDTEYINYYLNIFDDETPKFTLVPDESSYRRKIKNNRVLFMDRFTKQQRNADYYNLEDESYSEDHLYYNEDGYIGFSDYSIVGADFSESGFAPYAVVIHIVYFDNDRNLRIKHFVSESNDDINDPAGKFYEALEKLMEWQSEVKLDTFGMKEFAKHYTNGTYPGLGTVKKLSIMHHIELVNKFLEE
ncbi:sce7725 family protein [Halalkalibacterium halodurans]|uniref:sce7725 family protein n=1 Tax=Halalkalibacterium halodurans TaxID=86665 RepID=UPI002AAA17D4|nr:sce7725 family protein [Halalkalibacterium halodurans]MDY7224633.1 sce7725 family protein [Halalkalibacterium halodurans]MDY7240756.1 sce7725 family protein [Halalkalibacterium halodurans]